MTGQLAYRIAFLGLIPTLAIGGKVIERHDIGDAKGSAEVRWVGSLAARAIAESPPMVASSPAERVESCDNRNSVPVALQREASSRVSSVPWTQPVHSLRARSSRFSTLQAKHIKLQV